MLANVKLTFLASCFSIPGLGFYQPDLDLHTVKFHSSSQNVSQVASQLNHHLRYWQSAYPEGKVSQLPIRGPICKFKATLITIKK